MVFLLLSPLPTKAGVFGLIPDCPPGAGVAFSAWRLEEGRLRAEAGPLSTHPQARRSLSHMWFCGQSVEISFRSQGPTETPDDLRLGASGLTQWKATFGSRHVPALGLGLCPPGSACRTACQTLQSGSRASLHCCTGERTFKASAARGSGEED